MEAVLNSFISFLKTWSRVNIFNIFIFLHRVELYTNAFISLNVWMYWWFIHACIFWGKFLLLSICNLHSPNSSKLKGKKKTYVFSVLWSLTLLWHKITRLPSGMSLRLSRTTLTCFNLFRWLFEAVRSQAQQTQESSGVHLQMLILDLAQLYWIRISMVGSKYMDI